jgi:hypothetical protein
LTVLTRPATIYPTDQNFLWVLGHLIIIIIKKNWDPGCDSP